jgi:hypothetical protein
VVDKQVGAVLGYVWANDEDDAVPGKAVGGRALAEGDRRTVDQCVSEQDHGSWSCPK